MTIFLTGGTGFIGRAVAKALLVENQEVIALVRHPHSPQALALKQMGAVCAAGDILDRESMRASMSGADTVVHNAARYEFGGDKRLRRQMFAANVTGTENVLGLALELGIPRTIHVSTTEYYGETGLDMCDETHVRHGPCHSYYEETKVEAHNIALRYQERGLPLVIVCPNAVIGPNDHSPYGYFLRMYLNRVMMPFAWAPDIVISFVHVDDVAKGIALAVTRGRPGQTYILAGEPMRRRDFAAIWSTRPGGLKIRFYIPIWLAKILVAPLEPLERKLGLPALASSETVNGSVSLNYSSARAQRELGWTFRCATNVWQDTIEGELQLLAARTHRDLLSRLRPI